MLLIRWEKSVVAMHAYTGHLGQSVQRCQYMLVHARLFAGATPKDQICHVRKSLCICAIRRRRKHNELHGVVCWLALERRGDNEDWHVGRGRLGVPRDAT